LKISQHLNKQKNLTYACSQTFFYVTVVVYIYQLNKIEMKKLVTMMVCIACFSAIPFAQIPPGPGAPPAKAEMTKEEKKAMKAKQESDIQEALTGAGLTEDQVKMAKEIMAESNKKSNEIKSNDKMTNEEKDAAKKVINEEKNNKLKELMGADKYKVYNEMRKKQKAAAEEAKATQ
jgi:hypothetical protein